MTEKHKVIAVVLAEPSILLDEAVKGAKQYVKLVIADTREVLAGSEIDPEEDI